MGDGISKYSYIDLQKLIDTVYTRLEYCIRGWSDSYTRVFHNN